MGSNGGAHFFEFAYCSLADGSVVDKAGVFIPAVDKFGVSR
jgi:hypothetical protein